MLVEDLSQEQSTDKQETESRFDRVLEELRRDREEQARQWHANQQVINHTLASLRENEQKWAEQDCKWDEQNQKWWENQRVINQMLESMRGLDRKYGGTIGALGGALGLVYRGIIPQRAERHLGGIVWRPSGQLRCVWFHL